METKFNKLQQVDKKETPFKVPENYFAHFNEEMMHLLPEKKVLSIRPVTMWDKVKPWVYMAAMFVGLYVTINFLTQHGEGENGGVDQANYGAAQTESYWSNAQITEEEFYRYLEEQLVDEGYYDYMYNHYYLN